MNRFAGFTYKLISTWFIYFFSIWVFFHKHSRITGLQGKEEGISLFPQYHFHPLHRQLDISRATTAESSPCTYPAAGLKPGALGFRAQVANHYATRPKMRRNFEKKCVPFSIFVENIFDQSKNYLIWWKCFPLKSWNRP